MKTIVDVKDVICKTKLYLKKFLLVYSSLLIDFTVYFFVCTSLDHNVNHKMLHVDYIH